MVFLHQNFASAELYSYVVLGRSAGCFRRIRTLEDEQFKEILSRLDKITKLLSLSIVRTFDPDERILTLSSVGFQPAEIASLQGKTPNAVRIALHRVRKRARTVHEKIPQLSGDVGNTIH